MSLRLHWSDLCLSDCAAVTAVDLQALLPRLIGLKGFAVCGEGGAPSSLQRNLDTWLQHLPSTLQRLKVTGALGSGAI